MEVKWADYAIVGVNNKEEEKQIQKVKIREDTGRSLTNEKIVSRQEVINLLENGKKIITAYFKEVKWYKGDFVSIITVNGVKFIRTDGNKVEADNLGELPTF